MIYKNYDELTLLEVTGDAESVSFEELERAILKEPSNMVYCVEGRELKGIVSMGDIARASEAGKRTVSINRKFTCLSEGESIRARTIFREKENINALPVVNEKRELMGDYIRWDDLQYLEHIFVGGGRTPKKQKNYYCAPCQR